MDDKTLRAIAHLTEALYLLACVRNPGDRPTVPIHIGDNQIMVTPKTAEALADAIDSMNAYMASESVEDDKLAAAARQAQPAIDAFLDNDDASIARRLADLKAQTGSGEAIASGEFSAAAVAQCNPDLYADVTDVFHALDLVAVTRDVLNEPVASKLTVTLALDSLLGEVGDTYMDEDDAS